MSLIMRLLEYLFGQRVKREWTATQRKLVATHINNADSRGGLK